MKNFYKPNAKGTGHAIGLSFNSKEQKLYAQFVKQTEWHAESHTGSFKGGDKFTITFSEREIGVLLNCIERNISETLFHKSAKGNTSIDIKPYKRGEALDGFTISVNPRANEGEEKPQTFGFLFDKHEARVLRSFLEFVLEHYNSALYSEDKKKRAEYAKKNSNAPETNEGF